jgi:hypothetical protein
MADQAVKSEGICKNLHKIFMYDNNSQQQLIDLLN